MAFHINKLPRLTRAVYFICLLGFISSTALAEPADYLEDEKEVTEPTEKPAEATPARKKKEKKEKRRYFTDNSPRTDSGVFHVGFAVGGNYWMEPQRVQSTQALTGNYYRDFGFQVGVYFDHDYSELEENIPLMLRGMIGYKYMLSSVHAFHFEGIARRMFHFSEYASFGFGLGVNFGLWYRMITSSTSTEQFIFLPSIVIQGGFEFNPFMVDLKWLLNRFEADNVVTGFELSFGVRL